MSTTTTAPEVFIEPSVSAQLPDAEKEANRARFELELEFVQSLANPFYVHSLAQQNILEQPSFVNFVKYLQYWKEKDYARFIHYPHALHHLDLLQHAKFRAEMKNETWREYLNQKQFDHWRTWREPAHLNPPDSVYPTEPRQDEVQP